MTGRQRANQFRACNREDGDDLLHTELSLAARPARSAAGDRPVAYWLLVCCAMVYVMVVIGGVTRLTLSGLSIGDPELF